MKQRITYLDTIKGISIISVVLIHSLMNNANLYKVNHPVLLNWLHFYCVAAFFFVNGFLYNEKCVASPLKTILKRIKSYYIPYISYNCFFVLFHNFFIRIHLLNDPQGMYTFKTFIIAMIQMLFGKMQALTGPMWFLRALLLISIMYLLIDTFSSRVFEGKYRYVINTLATIIILIVSRTISLPTTFSFAQACGSFYIYYIGVLYRKFDLNRYSEKYRYVICLVCLAVTIAISNTIFVGINASLSYFWDFVATVFSIEFIVTLSQIKPVSDAKALRFLGNCSLEIMCLHFLSFKPISYFIVWIYKLSIDKVADIPVINLPVVNTFWQCIYTFSGLSIPVLFYLVKSAIKKKQSFQN